MNTVLITEIPFELNAEELARRLRIRNAHDGAAFEELARQAQAIARPRAAYRAVYLREVGEQTVQIDDTVFTSRVLAVNLKDAHRVFLFMATCGTELNDWSHGIQDMVHQFWAEEIKAAALAQATRALNAAIERDYDPGKTSVMNPGSLADWPLSEQRPFFALMNEAAEALGVTLNDSCLMTPNKSVTGIRFPLELRFESCQLCPMPDCPGRRAPHDPELYAARYAQRSA